MGASGSLGTVKDPDSRIPLKTVSIGGRGRGGRGEGGSEHVCRGGAGD